MKLVGRIISNILLVITALIALVFAFIELRSLFACDFLFMNNQAAAFIACLTRSLFFLILMGFAVCVFVSYLLKIELSSFHYVIAVSLALGSLFSVAFYTSYIYLLIVSFSIIPLIIVLFRKPK